MEHTACLRYFLAEDGILVDQKHRRFSNDFLKSVFSPLKLHLISENILSKCSFHTLWNGLPAQPSQAPTAKRRTRTV